MAFKFTDLSVVLNARTEDGEPKADLFVQTCGKVSLVMAFRTCGTATQNECGTNPDDLLRFGDYYGDAPDLAVLQAQLADMLASFGPDGTAAKKKPEEKVQKDDAEETSKDSE